MPSEGLAPKEIRTYARNSPKRTLLGSVWLNDEPGAMAAAAEVLARMGVNLTGSSAVCVKDSSDAEFGFFGEFSDSKITAELVQEKLGKLSSVKRCKIIVNKTGMLVDSLHYPLRFTSGQNAMVLRREVFADMLKRIRDLLGSGGSTIIYEMGVRAGEDDAKELIHEFGKDFLLGSLPDMVTMYMAIGWGRPEVVDLSRSPPTMTFRIHDNFECARQKSRVPNSQFIRGHIVGATGIFYRQRSQVTETRCMALGDPYCEFYSSQP